MANKLRNIWNLRCFSRVVMEALVKSHDVVNSPEVINVLRLSIRCLETGYTKPGGPTTIVLQSDLAPVGIIISQWIILTVNGDWS